jgi:hypothetical protein
MLPEEKKEEKKPVPNLKHQVFDYLNSHGPSLPMTISQEVGRESIFVGAVLSELIQSKQLKLSHAKIGGSRVYYVPGQEEKLSILYNSLPDAEKRAYDELKEKKLIKESETTPVLRVALDNLTDFSRQMILKDSNGNQQKAWMWHLSKPEDFQTKKQLPPEKPKEIAVQKPKTQEHQTRVIPQIQQPKDQIKKSPKQDTFSIQVESFFIQSGIKILEKEVIRKNTESNYIISIESQIGNLEMFVCAKNKKKISDQDLMLAHQKGQNKKLPTLFLTTGEQTKKAKDYITKNLKGYVIVKNL